MDCSEEIKMKAIYEKRKGQKTILVIIPIILTIGIVPALQFSEANAEPTQICIDKVWMENTKGKIACVTPYTAEKLVERGWGTILAEDKEKSVKGAWTIHSRTLPPPAGASDAFRESIINTPQPNLEESLKTPAFLTDEQWVQRNKMANDFMIQMTKGLAERFSVTITEDKIGGVPVYYVTPDNIDPANENRLFVHVHGGAYVVGGGLAGTAEAVAIANGAKIQVVSIDYSMPPERDPFPAAIDDIVAVWSSLLQDRPAKSMMLGGTSSGGGLALASTMKFKELGLDLPGAIYAGTPWADLTKTGDTHFTNEGIDRWLVTYKNLEAAAVLYSDGHDLKTPLLSPVYGDFTNFPPTILFSGTRDLFLSDTVRVHQEMRVAGVEADLHVFEAMSHGDYLMDPNIPEYDYWLNEINKFLQKHLQ